MAKKGSNSFFIANNPLIPKFFTYHEIHLPKAKPKASSAAEWSRSILACLRS